MRRLRLLPVFFALLLAPGLLAAQGNPAWQPLGPWGGSVISLALHPTDPQVLYAGGVLPGVVRSTDGGASWRLLPGSPSFPAFVALDPSQPATIYTSQQSARQIFKSTDGGTRWRRINAGLPVDLDISGLAVDPARPSRLYLGSSRRGVWRSLDGGASWQQASRGLPVGGNIQVLSLAVPRRPAGTAFINTSPYGLFRTRDAGASWKPIGNGLPAASQVFSLAIAPSDPQTVYASFANRVYRSEDGGNSWARAGQPPGGPTLIALAVHPRSARTVYGGTANSGIFKSTDGGRSWELTGAPTDVATIALALDSTRRGCKGRPSWLSPLLRSRGCSGPVCRRALSIAATTRGRPGRTRAAGWCCGTWWTSHSIRRTRSGSSLPASAACGYETNSGRPLWRSTDSGASWQLSGLGQRTVTRMAASPLPGVVWAYADGAVYRSRDHGATWQKRGDLTWGVSGFAFDPVHPERVYAATPRGVWVLEDRL